MIFKNPCKIKIVDSFLRLYGETLRERFAGDGRTVEFLPLPDSENRYRDIMVRLENRIYISESETSELGLSPAEMFASIAHELGHIVYGSMPFGVDAEMRADEFTAEVGLGSQMISVIEKIILSRRFRDITSSLVQRIQFLQHLA